MIVAGISSTQLRNERVKGLMVSVFLYFILYLQGNIRVFCRVRPLVDGNVSKHIQLPASDNKMITLAKTEEVRKSDPSKWQRKRGSFFLSSWKQITKLTLCFSVSHRQNY